MAQERLLYAILASLAAPETEGSGFDDPLETLSNLMTAVADVTEAVRVLRENACGRPPVTVVP
ncbi:hypothetical protein [Methylobacterium bullatum]|uniref:hypothetical protein n=1 Tax=Methylobacterium bullatum TaxID=570505 RepID=UPI0030CA780E